MPTWVWTLLQSLGLYFTAMYHFLVVVGFFYSDTCLKESGSSYRPFSFQTFQR